MLKKPKKFEVRKSKYQTTLWMWSSWWGFLEGYLSIDTFAKVAILYWYLFSSILPITNTYQNEQCKRYQRYQLMSMQRGRVTQYKAQCHSPQSSLIGRSSTDVLEGTFDDFKTEKIQCFHLFKLNAVRKHTVFVIHSYVCICSLGVTTLLVGERLEGGVSE